VRVLDAQMISPSCRAAAPHGSVVIDPGSPSPTPNVVSSPTLPTVGRWGWVFGRARIELSGAGYYHAGTAVGGLLGG
jgi:hypothetical protein